MARHGPTEGRYEKRSAIGRPTICRTSRQGKNVMPHHAMRNPITGCRFRRTNPARIAIKVSQGQGECRLADKSKVRARFRLTGQKKFLAWWPRTPMATAIMRSEIFPGCGAAEKWLSAAMRAAT